MRVLITGGTGVVGRSTVTALLQRGHVVQLFSRHAERDATQWSHGVHPRVGDVADADAVLGAADGCDSVLHLTAIVDEHGAATFERVNVEGTRNVLREAERARARKFVFVSSLGSDQGESPYQRSKRQGEVITRQFNGAWVIVRPGSVYGPGDEQISLLLRMIRTLPVLPILGGGDQRFQPIWHEDLAEILSRAVERDDLAGKELDVAGPEVTTQNDLVDRLSRITGRDVPHVEIPQMLARLGARLATAVGIGVPFNESQMQMLAKGSEIAPGRENALFTQFRLEGTPLDRGLRLLVDVQEEQLPEEGIGPLRRKRFWADVSGSAMTPEQLMTYFRDHFADVMASIVDARAEAATPPRLEENETLTLSLPLRGHIQMRVAEAEPRVVTLVTLAGHPLSGGVRFLSEARGDDVRFEVQVYERAANVADLLMMRTFGEGLQDASWHELVENVARASGGAAPSGVERHTETLDDDQATLIEEWLRDLVMERRREEAGI